MSNAVTNSVDFEIDMELNGKTNVDKSTIYLYDLEAKIVSLSGSRLPYYINTHDEYSILYVTLNVSISIIWMQQWLLATICTHSPKYNNNNKNSTTNKHTLVEGGGVEERMYGGCKLEGDEQEMRTRQAKSTPEQFSFWSELIGHTGVAVSGRVCACGWLLYQILPLKSTGTK